MLFTFLLLTIYCLLLTIYRLLFTGYYFTIYYLPITVFGS